MNMTLKRLLAELEDKIHEHEGLDSMSERTYNEGYAEACRWILDLIEENYLRDGVGFESEAETDDEW